MSGFYNKRFFITSLVLIIISISGCGQATTPSNDPPVDLTPTKSPVTEVAAGTVIPDPVSVFTPDMETYLPNPGVGWQNDHAHEEIFPFFPETIYYPVRHQIAWDVLNPAKGVYDWSALDAEYNRAIQEGKQFSFRVYTMTYSEYGDRIPDWVEAEGVLFTELGDPDYTSCVYQQEWGTFVNTMLERYDGDPNVAFIDISGYGDFNEWPWLDHQTAWDDEWAEAYESGEAGPATLKELDAQARRRLADMFIGGSFEEHLCRDASGQIVQTSYSYKGAQSTQLIMPYAGIRQSIQYVFMQRSDVGFRYDCLGRPGTLDYMPSMIGERWMYAPVVFELCSDTLDLQDMKALLEQTHGSVVHNNDFQDLPSLQDIILPIGYRFHLESAGVEPSNIPGDVFLMMTWKNIGSAPNYPRMGQEFELHVYIVDENDNVIVDEIAADKTSLWMPDVPQTFHVILEMPETADPGHYNIKVSLVEKRTGRPIYLAMGEDDQNGRYFATSFEYR